jgi:DNA-binding NarL/FixJ family response regulator
MKPKKKISIFIIEDNRLLREGITAMINEQTDLKVTGIFNEKEKPLSKLFSLKVDVVLIDLGLQTLNSLEVIKDIKEKSPAIKIIVMGLQPVQSKILDFVKAGASGFILKDAMVNEFLKTIRSVVAGEKVLPQHLTGSLFTQIVERAVNGTKKLNFIEAIRITKRERQVVILIADGQSNKEMGQILNLSPYTIKSHIHHILEKMALHSRAQIAKYAYSN